MPKHINTVYSPNKVYKVKIYEVPKWYAMPGDGSTKCAKLKLYKGSRLIKANCPDCQVYTSLIEIKWDVEDNWVWYTRGGGINLKTGKCY